MGGGGGVVVVVRGGLDVCTMDLSTRFVLDSGFRTDLTVNYVTFKVTQLYCLVL